MSLKTYIFGEISNYISFLQSGFEVVSIDYLFFFESLGAVSLEIRGYHIYFSLVTDQSPFNFNKQYEYD